MSALPRLLLLSCHFRLQYRSLLAGTGWALNGWARRTFASLGEYALATSPTGVATWQGSGSFLLFFLFLKKLAFLAANSKLTKNRWHQIDGV